MVSVAAKTRPPTTATPFGPSFGAVVLRDHRTRPVRRSSATTSDFHVCRYTVCPTTTGVAVSWPKSVPAPRMRYRQRSTRRPTEPGVIRDAVAARVLDEVAVRLAASRLRGRRGAATAARAAASANARPMAGACATEETAPLDDAEDADVLPRYGLQDETL